MRKGACPPFPRDEGGPGRAPGATGGWSERSGDPPQPAWAGGGGPASALLPPRPKTTARRPAGTPRFPRRTPQTPRGKCPLARQACRRPRHEPYPCQGGLTAHPPPSRLCSAGACPRALPAQRPAECPNVLTPPNFPVYTSLRPIGIRGCFITPSPLTARREPLVRPRGSRRVGRTREGRVRVKKALADFAPSGPCSPLDPFGGHIHCSKRKTRRNRPLSLPPACKSVAEGLSKC